MQIVNFGHFFGINSTGILLYMNEHEQDWYELRSALTTWDERGNFLTAIYGAWATVDVSGVVTNVEYDPSRLVPDNRTVLGIDADTGDIHPGMIYADGNLMPPPPASLEEIRATLPAITRRQLRLTLTRNGISTAAVSAAIEAMPDSLEKEEARIEWEDASTYNRLHPTLVHIADVLSLDADQVDAMWAQALAIS